MFKNLCWMADWLGNATPFDSGNVLVLTVRLGPRASCVDWTESKVPALIDEGYSTQDTDD